MFQKYNIFKYFCKLKVMFPTYFCLCLLIVFQSSFSFFLLFYPPLTCFPLRKTFYFFIVILFLPSIPIFFNNSKKHCVLCLCLSKLLQIPSPYNNTLNTKKQRQQTLIFLVFSVIMFSLDLIYIHSRYLTLESNLQFYIPTIVKAHTFLCVYVCGQNLSYYLAFLSQKCLKNINTLHHINGSS